MTATIINNEEKLTDLFQNIGNLSFELPDPNDDSIQEGEFNRMVAKAWQDCDRCDLHTEILRGRILISVRDREKKGGDGRGRGFLNWLKEHEISKSQAYSWIQLANSADALIVQGNLDESTLKQFSKRAFVETSKAAPEVQQMVTEAARQGDRITRREVNQLAAEYNAMTSDLLPDAVKAAVSDQSSLTPRHLTPLLKELEKLPAEQLEIIQEEIAADPTQDTIKEATREAKDLSTFLDTASRVSAFEEQSIDIHAVSDECLRQDNLTRAAKVSRTALQVQEMTTKLYTAWSKLNEACDRLYADTGANSALTRSMLSALDHANKGAIEIPFGDQGKRIRLKLELVED